jgi:hypothetical protein
MDMNATRAQALMIMSRPNQSGVDVTHIGGEIVLVDK